MSRFTLETDNPSGTTLGKDTIAHLIIRLCINTGKRLDELSTMLKMIHLSTIASTSFLVYFLCLLSFPDGTNAWLFSSSSSSRSQSDETRSHDITSQQDLTELYNSPVESRERVTRPLGVADKLGLKHSGVVVTTENGDRWLVHKGKEYGDSSETVVTNAKHMSGAWKSEGSEQVQPGTKVADYVKAGGENYNVVNDNCHDGSERMMNVGREEKPQE